MPAPRPEGARSTAIVEMNKDIRLHPGKTTPPTPPSDVIARKRILDRLTQARTPVSLLLAPAGFGKTTAMRQWFDVLTAGGESVAWLTLDERDNDYARLLAYLRSVFGALIPLPAAGPTSGDLAYARLDSEALALADAVGCSGRPFTLFIDDLEKLHCTQGVQFLSDLILGLGAGQRIVIGARSMMAMPLSALSLRGGISAVNVDELRFTFDEVADFIRRRDTDDLRAATDVAHLLGRTEGWPAGLRLMTLPLPTLSKAQASANVVSGRLDSFSAYLTENVLVQLPEHHRRFLLECSTLELLNAEICDKLLERNDSAEILHSFLAVNLFITPVGPTGNWFKFHPLLRDVLGEELKRHDPEAVTKLHHRAALILAQEGHHSAAVTHALLSNDATLAATIVEDCCIAFVETSQLETVGRWLDALDPAEVARRPTLQRAKVYAMIALHRFEDAHEALAQLRAGAHGAEQDLPVEIHVQMALLFAWRDRHDLAAVELAKSEGQIVPDDGLIFGTALNIQAHLDFLTGDYDQATHRLSTAKAAHSHVDGNLWSLTFTYCFEGAVNMIHGNLQGAMERFDTAAHDTRGANPLIARAYLADALYAQDALTEAAAVLGDHLQVMRRIGSPDVILLSFRTSARIAFLSGDISRAEAILTALKDIADTEGIPRLKIAAWLEKSRLALLQGKLDAARRLLKLASTQDTGAECHAQQPYTQEIDDLRISRMRLELVVGTPGALIGELETEIHRSDLQERNWRKLKLMNLLAQAQFRAGRIEAALRTLQTALELAADEGFVRVFSDEPWFLAPLLHAMASQRIQPAPALVKRISASLAGMPYKVPSRPPVATDRVLLTGKEAEIMGLVADGRANKEIARILGITENTVESHLRRINQKLQTTNRTQAVSRARACGILH